MPLSRISLVFAATAVVVLFLGQTLPSAQEERISIDHPDVFTPARRPPVEFPHARHEETLDAQGCGACHHGPDPETGRLVYLDGEEQACKTCHGLDRVDRMPALREAFHRSCTGCHRKMKAENRETGPTTCGECHKK